MTGCCTLLLYGAILAGFGLAIKALTCGFGGAPGTRTLNLRIKSPQLCH